MPVHPFDIITLENGAKLILTPCPGSKGASLESSIATFKQAGTTVLLTLMFNNDMMNNSISTLPQRCEKNNIIWHQLPIVDDGVPCEIFERLWHKHIDALSAVINNQGTITIHCKGGYGRTGLVAGLILRHYGLMPEDVLKKIQKIRPNSLKNRQQLDYFYAYQKP